MERLEAMSRFRVHAPAIEHWIGMLLILVLLAMIALLAWVSYNKIQYARMAAAQAFLDNATRRSLSNWEYKLLLEIARRSGLRGQNKNLIYTSADLYQKGLQNLARELLKRQGPEAYERLMADAAFLREKLGLTHPARGQPAISHAPVTTHDIPIGKTLQITRRLANQSDQITATLVGNDPKQLTVELDRPIRITFGELWRVRYAHGASVWEFDTSVMSFDGMRLVLKHSSEVRFLNRRRFVRSSVTNNALVARLPFIQSLQQGLDQAESPIQFAKATVQELAGPGLRLLCPVAAQVTERLLILFELPAGKQLHLVSDIGIVRRVEATEEGYLLAVELTGHKETDLEELVRLSRGLASNSGKMATDQDDSQDQDKVVEQIVAEGRADV